MEKSMDVPFRLQLMKRVQVWRSRMIANSLQKHPAQRRFFTQSLYLTLEQSTTCVPDIECQEYYTPEIPIPIRTGNLLFSYVGGIDGKSPYREIVQGMGTYAETSRFAKLFHVYRYDSSRIWIPENTTMVLVSGIFDDPFEASKYSCQPGSTLCDTWDSEYPLSGDLLQIIIDGITREMRVLPDMEQSKIELNPSK